jgi:CubicO group peptidase (beta-lactamase class C family)
MQHRAPSQLACVTRSKGMAVTDGAISGLCDPAFSKVADEFHNNFAERGEVGASVCIYVDGKCVVDLWGGIADQANGRTWDQDTIVPVFSTTKGLAALCLHVLASRGLIDFEEPVARYWPEFAANGKADISVATMISHQAGLAVWQQPLPVDALYDWELAAGRLAAEAPLWEPGTAHGYHGLTIGWLMGELIRRVDGRSIGRFFHEEVAKPLDADAWIGLPEYEHHRVATLYMADVDFNSPFFRKLQNEPDWYGCKMGTNDGGDIRGDTVNSARRWSMEHASAGGIANARSIARVYAPLALDGSVNGIRIVGEAMLPGMRTVRSASHRDLILQLPTTFTLGFSKTWGARHLGQGEHVIIGEQAFGTPGMGGSIGFADGQACMSFGYAMNRHGSGVCLNDRGQSLIDAAYRAVGFASSAPGFWVKDYPESLVRGLP